MPIDWDGELYWVDVLVFHDDLPCPDNEYWTNKKDDAIEWAIEKSKQDDYADTIIRVIYMGTQEERNTSLKSWMGTIIFKIAGRRERDYLTSLDDEFDAIPINGEYLIRPLHAH